MPIMLNVLRGMRLPPRVLFQLHLIIFGRWHGKITAKPYLCFAKPQKYQPLIRINANNIGQIQNNNL